MSELPESWVETAISELGIIVSGGTPSTKIPDFWGGDIIWYSPADLTGYTAKFINRGAKNLTQEGLENSSAKLMPAGSVMFSSRAPIGYVAITSVEAATNQGFKSLVPSKEISADYVYHYLKSAKQMAEERASGTTFLELSGRAFSQLPVPVPPLYEQRRIVEKIETLFAELDKGEESLRTAKARAGLYRQSLLKHAFEGHLTADWRAANPDKLEDAETLLTRIQDERDARYKQALDDWQIALEKWRDEGEGGKRPAKPRRDPEPDKPSPQQQKDIWELPSSWQWLQIGEFAFVTKLAGFEYTKHVNYREDGDLPVLKAENAGPLGFKKTDYSLVKRSEVEMLTRSHLRGGELLMTFVGAGTGQVATVPNDQEYFLGPNIGMMRIISDDINPQYIEHFLRSPKGEVLKMAAVKAVAQPSLSMGTIRQIPVAVPSPQEQTQIVNILDAKLSTLNAVENQLADQIARSKALRQSILKRAFAGELVAQDPYEEPASKLLERIKAEKAEAEIAAKVNRKTKPPRKPMKRRPTMADLIEVLKKEGDWVSASKAAQGLGIANGASSDDVEAFYRQLKERIEAKEIEVERRGDEDWLRLVKVEAN